MNYKKGEFTAATATGHQAVIGLGFTPKALKLYVVPLTADGVGNPGNICIGMTDGTNSRCATAAANDNVNPTVDSGKNTTDLLNILLNATPTQDGIASIVSLDSDGFTINWSTACSSAWKIVYEAWGGTDITVAVGTWNPSSGTGSKAKTGLGFKPSFIQWLQGQTTTVNPSIGFGAASGAGAEFGVFMTNTTGRTVTPNARYAHDAASINFGSGGVTTQKATLTSFDSDGWTYNFSARGNTTDLLYYMAIAGGNWMVGAETTPTATGTKQTSGVGFQPIGVSLFGIFEPTTTATTSGQANACFGGADGISSNGYSAACGWGSGNTPRNGCGVNPNVIGVVNPTGSGFLIKADLSAWDSNSFTLNYATVQSTAREFGYIAFGAATTALGVSSVLNWVVDVILGVSMPQTWSTKPQMSSPSSDASAGSWTPSAGATLFGTIDEATVDDSDYDQSGLSPGSADIMKVKFAALEDPTTSNDGVYHHVRYRIGKNATGGDSISVTVRLMQGATEVAHWTHTGVDPLATYDQTLTDAQANAITDYSNLFLQVEAISP